LFDGSWKISFFKVFNFHLLKNFVENSMGKTLIIAEAGVNHNGKMDLAFKLVDAAAAAGADYVKFQTFQASKLVSKQAKMAQYQIDNMQSESSQWEMLKQLELSKDQHYALMEYCNQKGIQFLSTAFDMESLAFLHSLNFNHYKVPSGEITNKPYLQQMASFGKEVILSTGMSDKEEIANALKVLTTSGLPLEKVIVLHCNTEYPTPMKDVNLRALEDIHQTFGVRIGYSDHTLGIEVPIAAVAMGAVCIEKHFTLDRTMSGPDHKASLEPGELKEMVQAIRNIELALGHGIKIPSESESKNKIIARKSIHLCHELPAGSILSMKDLEMKRPGDGISPMEIEQVIGRTLKNPKQADEKLLWEDLE
jgi:N-acetylneuraminate synthase